MNSFATLYSSASTYDTNPQPPHSVPLPNALEASFLTANIAPKQQLNYSIAHKASLSKIVIFCISE